MDRPKKHQNISMYDLHTEPTRALAVISFGGGGEAQYLWVIYTHTYVCTYIYINHKKQRTH